ncbi:MAG TPA: cupin domain-containing protein [Solirubrobacteraceae bacterium]|nr:cupin domain-containing protein [Solirubrobacteraceae bacterium]
MTFRALAPRDFEWTTRPHEQDEPARHVAELSETLGASHVRANVWRYEPGAKGRRHRHAAQEETFVVLKGTLTMYLGDPPVRVEVPTGGVINVSGGTPLQSANHGADELVVYAYGYPPDQGAEVLDSAL